MNFPSRNVSTKCNLLTNIIPKKQFAWKDYHCKRSSLGTVGSSSFHMLQIFVFKAVMEEAGSWAWCEVIGSCYQKKSRFFSWEFQLVLMNELHKVLQVWAFPSLFPFSHDVLSSPQICFCQNCHILYVVQGLHKIWQDNIWTFSLKNDKLNKPIFLASFPASRFY